MIFEDILFESKLSNWSLEKVRDYISSFDTMMDFTKDPKYSTIKTYIYRNYNPSTWEELTKHLYRATPNLQDNDVVTSELSKQFPQWDFSNVTYRFVDGRRYMDGLICNKKNEDGSEHGVSNNISVHDLKKRGSGCRICGKNRILSSIKINIQKWIDEFPKDRKLVFDPNKFFYKSEGLNQKTLFVKDVICTNHLKPFVFGSNGVNVHNLRKGKTGCPICGKKESKGEKKVLSVLKNLGYSVNKQKTFEGCYGFSGKKYCDLLKFDAYIIKNDGTEVCVEYDGIQHYEPVPFFGGEEGFESLKSRDQIKTQYCIDNNIQLIRIPYWEFDNIETILTNEIGYEDNTLQEDIHYIKRIIQYHNTQL